jgi:hypothetical protein
MRVDTHLADGVNIEQVDRWVQTASILHSNGDAMDIAVSGGRIVGVRGREVDRVNHGRLGPKDLFGWQANAAADRLTRPMVRESGRLVETDWNIAMDRVVRRSKDLLDERGPSALGFYTTGQLFLEDYYTLGVIAHGAIGTNHVDGNTRLCTATAAEALVTPVRPPGAVDEHASPGSGPAAGELSRCPASSRGGGHHPLPQHLLAVRARSREESEPTPGDRSPRSSLRRRRQPAARQHHRPAG